MLRVCMTTGSAVPKHQMLHECFTFKQPHSGELAPLIEALNLMAGDRDFIPFLPFHFNMLQSARGHHDDETQNSALVRLCKVRQQEGRSTLLFQVYTLQMPKAVYHCFVCFPKLLLTSFCSLLCLL